LQQFQRDTSSARRLSTVALLRVLNASQRSVKPLQVSFRDAHFIALISCRMFDCCSAGAGSGSGSAHPATAS
jgi:hypothetical protein